MKKYANREQGNILLFCLVIMVIIISVSSMLNIIIASRAVYVRKSADYNDNVLLLEDANIRYTSEFLGSQAETSELVVYYFQNRYYTKQTAGSIAGGYKPIFDRYLRETIDPSVQREIHRYYSAKEAEQEALRPPANPDGTRDPIDYSQLNNDVSLMAGYLYCSLLTARVKVDGGSHTNNNVISVFNKLRKVTGKPSDPSTANTVNGDLAAKYGVSYGKVTFEMSNGNPNPPGRPDSEEWKKWTSGKINGKPALDYLSGKYNSPTHDPVYESGAHLLTAAVSSEIKIDPAQMKVMGVSDITQYVELEMLTPISTSASYVENDADPNHGKGYYEVELTLPESVDPKYWLIKSIK